MTRDCAPLYLLANTKSLGETSSAWTDGGRAASSTKSIRGPFRTSNHDGIGDLRGIAARLDYLVELGVDAVWVSPIFPSPMADFGYDVSNYTDIDPMFGTLSDFDALVAAAHARGLEDHPGFRAQSHVRSASVVRRKPVVARQRKARLVHLARPEDADGGVPNNWISEFGGSAWTFDETTRQYYYHAFLKEQPDLNWRNPEVRTAMLGVLRFWLDRGVDGFRVDAIHHLIEAEHLKDNPPNPDWREGQSPARRLARVYSLDQAGDASTASPRCARWPTPIRIAC